MSREIKFRAWDKKSKKIREVNCIVFHNIREAFSFNKSNSPKLIHLWGYDTINQKDIILYREEKDVVLTQFTGHVDKNGKEIYEGDIIKAKTVDVIHPQDAFKIKEEYVTSPVYWDSYLCSFETDFNCFSFGDSKNFEIIGNIYEN